MKLSKSEEKLRQELVTELEETGQAVERSFADLLAALERLPSDVNMSIRRYNSALLKAKVFAEGLAESFRESYEEKSDSWRESDAGGEADSFVSEWEEFRAETLPLIEIVEPELEEKICHAKKLRDLPLSSS